MDAEQGISLVDLLEPAVTVPVHYDDYTVFPVTVERFRGPVASGRSPR